MPSEDIIRIATTCAIIQGLVSIAFDKFVFSKESYERAVSQVILFIFIRMIGLYIL